MFLTKNTTDTNWTLFNDNKEYIISPLNENSIYNVDGYKFKLSNSYFTPIILYCKQQIITKHLTSTIPVKLETNPPKKPYTGGYSYKGGYIALNQIYKSYQQKYNLF